MDAIHLRSALEDYSRCMDKFMEQAALLALFRDRKSKWGVLADEIEASGSALKTLESSVYGTGQGELFTEEPGTRFEAELARARTAISQWAEEGMRLVTLLDEDYPAQLLTIHQRPPFLLYR